MRAMSVSIEAGGATLQGELVLPTDESGVVVLGHHAPPGVLEALHERGLGTLVVDLRAGDQAHDREVLGSRLIHVSDWLTQSDLTATRPVGLLGTNSDAGATFMAAAERPERIAAVVSESGLPEGAREYLDQMSAPTLLLVNANDDRGLDRARAALQQLTTPSAMQVVVDTPEDVDGQARTAELAADWFATNLVGIESPIDEPPVAGTGGMSRFGDIGREERAVAEGRVQRRSRT